MSSEETKDSSPPPGGDQLPAERPPADSTWEVVLSNASQQTAAQPPTPAERGPSNWSGWLRAAVPILIILVYAIYKLSGMERAPQAAPEISHGGSLSGVQADRERIRISRETEELLRRLEGSFQSRDWNAIVTTVNSSSEEMRAHPVVEAFELIARTFQGEVSGEVRTRIRKLLPRFQDDKARQQLYGYLLLADATMEMRATSTPEQAIRNADYFRQAIRRQSVLTPEVVNFRTRLAERYERMADMRMEEAGGFRADKTKLSEARSLYQHALRWVIVPENWLQLQPISAGEPATARDRILVKLRKANDKFHGITLPLRSNDGETWTAKAGDPVHDLPGGAW